MSSPTRLKREMGSHLKYDYNKPQAKRLRRNFQPHKIDRRLLARIEEMVNFEEELAVAED